MCANLFLSVYRGKKRSEKYTLIHQCFFRRTGTRVHNSIFFFSFYSMHFRIVYICYKKRTIFTIFKNNVIRKKRNLQNVVKWGRWIITLWSTISCTFSHTQKPFDSFFTDLRKPILLCLTSPTEGFCVYLDYSQVFPQKHKCEIT